MPYLQSAAPNARLVVFAGLVSLIAALAFAFAPVMRLSVSETAAGLKDAGRGSAGMHWRRFGAHLVIVELAVAVFLLVGAGLLGKSLYRLVHVETGFTAQGLATVGVVPTSVQAGNATDGTAAAGQDPPGRLARRVADRIAALPGVESVAYADHLPLAPGLAPASSFWVPGRPEGEQLKDGWPIRRVSAGYFETLQARLIRGRYFTDDEVSSARQVMIINETAAGRYFPGQDPIGRAIAFGGAAAPPREIVGVVADIKDGPPETPAHPSAYVPFDQPGFGLIIRAQDSERAVFPLLAPAIREIRADAFVSDVTTMSERLNQLPSASLQRLTAWLVGGFAALAFVLSVVGLYGVVAYSVGQRTCEIGVRMALGAQGASISRLVIVDASVLVGVGTVLGIVCAVAAATLMRHLLFGVQSWDPATLAAAAMALTVSAFVACYIPARRAASLNPIDVLRAE